MFGLSLFTRLFPSITEFQAKIIGLFVALALVAFALGTVTSKVYHAGYDSGIAEGNLAVAAAQNQGLQEYARMQRALIDTQATVDDLERQVQARLTQATTTGEIHVKTVERIIHDHPDFAAIARPADLDSVRQQDLADIAAAAARGESAAAKLPGGGIRTVPAASSDHGKYAGRDRTGRHSEPHTLVALY